MLLVKGLVGDNIFDSALKDASLKQDTALALKTFNTYISTKSDNLPFITAAGMLLLKTVYITEFYIQYHVL